MIQLSKYSPAETLLVIEDKRAGIKELLKTTFMDLLLKQVLEIKIVSRQSSSGRDKVRSYKYIIKGKNFNAYKALEHEIVFLSPYQKSNSIKILFQHLIKMGFQNSISEAKYQSSIRKSSNISHYFTKNFFQTVFGGFSINNDGLELRNKIKVEIAQLEKELPPIITSDKEQALQILHSIGGNIFHLKNIEFSLIKQIDSEILAEMNRYNSNEGGGSGCYGCSSWDTGCTGCSSSGCSSSGCSGCSGCGGCGGGCS